MYLGGVVVAVGVMMVVLVSGLVVVVSLVAGVSLFSLEQGLLDISALRFICPSPYLRCAALPFCAWHTSWLLFCRRYPTPVGKAAHPSQHAQ